MDVKKQLIEACKQYAEARIVRFNTTIKELEDALKPESRSSMGDKYETSRAMLHLEFEKVSGQVEQFTNLRKTAGLIEQQPTLESVAFGSVVITTAANYFISIAAGEITVQGHKYYAVGVNAPISQVLWGKKVGDFFVLNGARFEILKTI